MWRNRHRLAGIAFVTLLMACAPLLTGCVPVASGSLPPMSPAGSGSPPASITPAPSAAPPTATPAAQPSEVAPPWPTYDPATLLGDRLVCRNTGSPTFSVEEWNDAPIVPDTDGSSEAQALRRELTDGSGLDRFTWHRVVTRSDEVLFAAGTGGGPPEDALAMVFIPDSQQPGSWKWRDLGTCLMGLSVESDRSRADVFLDPDHLPASGDQVMHVMIRETACASGRSPLGRVLPPVLRIEASSITVLITVSRLPGEQDCQGVDAVPYDLVLPEPLGERTLLDGGHVPATPIEAEPCCG